MTIEDTSRRDPLLHAIGILAEGQTDYITGMEAAGQAQLVSSDRLPVNLIRGTDEDYLALGFTFGPPDPADPLFRSATLPEGWTREASDHDMWSYIIDERGIRRVSIFYKAAFYDRHAHMSIDDVGRSVAYDHIYGDEEEIAGLDLLTDEERAGCRAAAEEYAGRGDIRHGPEPAMIARAEKLLEVLGETA